MAALSAGAFERGMGLLEEVFGREGSGELRLRAYAAALSDLRDDQYERAVAQLLTTFKFGFPKPADIREAVAATQTPLEANFAHRRRLILSARDHRFIPAEEARERLARLDDEERMALAAMPPAAALPARVGGGRS